MGQQQLLLLVLATVIVGLATVAGIQAFEQGQTRANQDALTNTAVKVASDIQARIKEPSQFGGYDGSMSDATGTNGISSISEFGYTTNSNGKYETSNGTCEIGSTGSLSAPDDVNSTNIKVLCSSDENEVVAWVDGTNPDDIVSRAKTVGS
jgi:hypothetical protein